MNWQRWALLAVIVAGCGDDGTTSITDADLWPSDGGAEDTATPLPWLQWPKATCDGTRVVCPDDAKPVCHPARAVFDESRATWWFESAFNAGPRCDGTQYAPLCVEDGRPVARVMVSCGRLIDAIGMAKLCQYEDESRNYRADAGVECAP